MPPITAGLRAFSLTSLVTHRDAEIVAWVFSSGVLLRPSGPDRSRGFYRDVLCLALHRDFGPPEDRRVVFFFSKRAGDIGQRDSGAFGCGT